LSVAPASVAVGRGASFATTVSVTRSGGFTGPVTLAATGLPTGVSVAFNPSPATGATSTATFTASATAALGASTVTLTGTGGGLSRTTTVSLTVTAGPAPGTLTATPVVTTNSAWFNELQLRVSHTANLTALTVTIVVQRTPGVAFSGQYNTVGGQIRQASASTTATVTYTFALAAGQTLSPATNRTFAAQTSGNGAVHPTSGDTWTVSYTSGGQSFTQSGNFP
jgi:hypothetical protein